MTKEELRDEEIILDTKMNARNSSAKAYKDKIIEQILKHSGLDISKLVTVSSRETIYNDVYGSMQEKIVKYDAKSMLLITKAFINNSKVADVVEVSKDTLYRWVSEYRQGFMKGMAT